MPSPDAMLDAAVLIIFCNFIAMLVKMFMNAEHVTLENQLVKTAFLALVLGSASMLHDEIAARFVTNEWSPQASSILSASFSITL